MSLGKTVAYDQPTNAPTAKVAAGGIGGALTVLLVFLAGEFRIELTAEVASALTTIISFLCAYIVRDKRPASVVEAVELEKESL